MVEINLNQRYILQNFLNGAAKKSDDSSKLTQKTTIKETDENLVNKSLEKYLKDFALGNITYKNFEVFMLGLGAKDYSQKNINGKIIQTFSVNGKKFEISTNKQAANSGADSVVDNAGSYLKYNEWSEANEFSNKYNVNGKRTDKFYYNDKGQITSEIKFNANGEKVGNISYSYDTKGNIKTETVYNYDKSTGKNILQTQKIHNLDGTVTMYTFDKEGTKKYIAGTFKEGECIYQNPSDITKTTTSDYKDSNGKKIGTYEYERGVNGKITVRRCYDLNGKLTQILNYIYDNDNNIERYSTIYLSDDGSYTTNVYNKDWQTEKYTKYNANGKITNDYNYSYNAKNEKIGYTRDDYDVKTGKKKETVVYNYDKTTNKTIPQTQYIYNADGTVTMYTFNKEGTKKYIAGTFKEGECIYQNPSDITKTTTSDYKDSNGKKIGTYEYERGVNGKITVRRCYDLNGKLTQILNYIYDNENNIAGYNTINLSDDGSYTTNVYNKDWLTEKYTKYNANGKITNDYNYSYNAKKEKIGYTRDDYDVKTGKKKETVVYNYDKTTNKTIPQTQYVHNSDGTVTMYTFDKDGKTKYIAGTFNEGEFAYIQPSDLSRTKVVDRYDSNKNKIGTYEYEYDANGKETVRRTYDINGNLTQTYNYMRDDSGKYVTGLYFGAPNSSGNYTTGVWRNSRTESSVTYNSSNTVVTETNYTFNANGDKTGLTQTTYNPSTGKAKTTTVYSYDKANNKNIPQTQYVHNSDGTVTMYTFNKDGSKKYIAGTFKEGEYAYIQPSDLSRTKVVNRYDSNKNKIGTYEYEYDANGKETVRRTYDINGNLTQTYNYMRDDSGKCVTGLYFGAPNSSGNYTAGVWRNSRTESSVTYNSSNTVVTETNYTFNANGDKTGLTQTTYNPSTGKAKTTTVYSYDKANNKNIPQTQYVYNTDGTVTMYTFSKDGKTKYNAGTFNEGECTVQNPSDITKTTTSDYKDSNGKKIGTYEYERGDNGKITVRRRYDLNGKLTQILNYIYDNENNIAGYNTINLSDDGSYTTNVYNKDWQTEKYTKYNANGKITNDYNYSYNAKKEKIGYTRDDYDVKTGKKKETVVYNYDKTTNKTIPQTQYVHNADGTVTMYTFSKDGKTKYQSGIFKEGEFAIMNVIDQSKEQTVDIKDSSGKKTGYCIKKYDSKGKLVLTEWYDLSGKLTKIDNYMYDNTGKSVQINNVVFNADGSYSSSVWKDNKTSETTNFDKNGKKTNRVIYSYDGNGNKLGHTQINYNKDTGKEASTLVYRFDKATKKNILQSKYINNPDNTITYYTYNDGKMYYGCNFTSGEFTFDNVIDTSKTKTGDLKDSSGNKTGTYIDKYDSNGKKVVREYYDLSGKLTKIDHCMYDNNGKLVQTQYTAINSDGSYNAAIWKDSVTTEVVKFDKNNKKTQRITYTYDSNKKRTGYTTFTYNSNGSVVRRDYDANGNTKTGRQEISGSSITIDGITLSTQKIYDGLTGNLDKGLFQAFLVSWTARDALEIMGGEYTASFFEASQVNSTKKPLGCNGTVYHVNDEGSIKDFVYNKLQRDCGLNTMGYDPEQVKGYHWNANSNLCKKMATDSDMKSYIINNINNIINGKVDKLPCLSFENNKDLYYAIHGTEVIDAKITGTTLKLKLMDVYDFNLKNISKVKNSGTKLGSKFDGIGAAAMKDGKLVPYYQIFEVNIDLKTIFTNSKLKNLGII